jgi:hypothetical protein
LPYERHWIACGCWLLLYVLFEAMRLADRELSHLLGALSDVSMQSLADELHAGMSS